MSERHLTDADLKELDKNYKPEVKWDGVDRRKAISSTVDPMHDRRTK